MKTLSLVILLSVFIVSDAWFLWGKRAENGAGPIREAVMNLCNQYGENTGTERVAKLVRAYCKIVARLANETATKRSVPLEEIEREIF